MNTIEKEITTDDQLRAKRRQSDADRAAEMLRNLELACPFGTTFIQGIPADQKRSVEAELKKQFEIWANSYIAPTCREIIARATR